MRDDAQGIFWHDLPPPPKVIKEKVLVIPPEPVWLEDNYLPHLKEAQETVWNVFANEELERCAIELDITGKKHVLIYDIECYINYFLVAFKSYTLSKIIYFEFEPGQTMDLDKIKWIMNTFCVVGFNSSNYDNFMTFLAIGGLSNKQLKTCSDALIVENVRGKDLLKSYKLSKDSVDNIDGIDLMNVAPLTGSLKIYGGRLHTKVMQDLPFPPSTVLSKDQITIIRWYCIKGDITATFDLYKSLKPQLTLRGAMSGQYGLDLRSCSDAQIAEKVICRSVQNKTGEWPQKSHYLAGHTFRYKIPKFVKFKNPTLKWVLNGIRNSDFILDYAGASEKLKVIKPAFLKKLKFNVGASEYTMGIGGLHSNEKSIAYTYNQNYLLLDRDISSNYPIIILNQKLSPANMGDAFLSVYRTIVETRLAAKKEGNNTVANSLKIVINSSFGKFGSAYSKLFAPELMIQVTLTGQLALLMLIERIEEAGIKVVSGNTDGVVIKCHKLRYNDLNNIVKEWEQDTEFDTEETRYRALYSRDVNNYFAIKMDGSTKAKGTYSDPGLSKNPTTLICSDAVSEFLKNSTPLETTIRQCQDITKFVAVKNVAGGGAKVYEDGTIEYLGKAVRWYYANEMNTPIVYAYKGNKVGKTDGAKPLMTLPDSLPKDLNYEWYSNEAKSILKDIGVTNES